MSVTCAPNAKRGFVNIVHVIPDLHCARFAMDCMCKSTATEIIYALISSGDFWVFWSATFISVAIPHLFIPGFLRFT